LNREKEPGSALAQHANPAYASSPSAEISIEMMTQGGEIEFGRLSKLGSNEGRNPISEKFVANKLIVGQLSHAAHGLANFMGISSEQEGEIKQQGLKAIRAEFHNFEDKMRASGSATEKQEAAQYLAIVLYILDDVASELEEHSNDGKSTIIRDEGHAGMRLADFKQQPDAISAKLEDTHIAALRIYTSQAFGRINGPLRKKEQPHPFAATTLFISEGLKQLRAVHAVGDQATQTKEFWRGMKVMSSLHVYIDWVYGWASGYMRVRFAAGTTHDFVSPLFSRFRTWS
jgi:hypothetical protein